MEKESFDTFKQVAERRSIEAAQLPGSKARYYDGTAMLALLSAECSLKALILHENGADKLENLPQPILQKAFKGKSGHDLSVLYQQLSGKHRIFSPERYMMPCFSYR